VIYRFRIEQQTAPGRVAYHSRVMLNEASEAWSSSPEPGGYHIGTEGRGFWARHWSSDGSESWIFYDTVHRGDALRRAGHAMILQITQLVIAEVTGTTGDGYVYRSALPAFRGEVLWRLTYP